MKTILTIALFFTTVLNTYSQYIVNGTIQDGNRPNLEGIFKPIGNDSNDNIEGSQYIDEVFIPVKISIDENKLYSARYNAFSDEFEIKGDDDKAYLLNKYRTDLKISFINTNKSYKSIKYINEDDFESIGYFIILNDDNIKLLKKESITFIEGKTGITSYERDKPAQYRRVNDKFYFKINDNSAIVLPKKDKDIANSFPQHSKAILAYIKSEKIKTKKEEDLIKLFEYINTL